MHLLAWLVVTAVALFALDRLALAAEARNWIYWRRAGPRRTTAGQAMLGIQAIFEPQIQHVVRERSQIGAEQPGDGEPEAPGATRV